VTAVQGSDRYLTSDYLSQNPDWHVTDSPWKAAQILGVLGGRAPAMICEVGCGAGEILSQLHDRLPKARLVGYEIAPDAFRLAQRRATDRLSFRLCDAAEDSDTFDLMLIIDVIEHVSDPIAFLAALRFKAHRTVLHIPLDLSVQSVLRPQKLLQLRRTIGHIHYFTPETAIATVEDAGYRIDVVRYTPSFALPPKSLKARMARVPRRLFPRDTTVRLLGGYSLLVSTTNN
jgi:SAM-dependent methyltransferase